MPLPKEVVEEILESITTSEKDDDATTIDLLDFSTRTPLRRWKLFDPLQRTKKKTSKDKEQESLKTPYPRGAWEDLNVILDQYIQDMDLDDDDIGGSP